MTERIRQEEEKQPATGDEKSSIVESNTADRLRASLRVATLSEERPRTDVLSVRRLRTESHTSRPLVERSRVLNLHKLSNNLKGRGRRARSHLELKQRTNTRVQPRVTVTTVLAEQERQDATVETGENTGRERSVRRRQI